MSVLRRLDCFVDSLLIVASIIGGGGGGCVWSLFCNGILNSSSFAIISLGKNELDALL